VKPLERILCHQQHVPVADQVASYPSEMMSITSVACTREGLADVKAKEDAMQV
jgi:hypothetical protein